MFFFSYCGPEVWQDLCLIGIFSSTLPADIGGNVINITIVINSESCTDGKYDQSSLLLKLKELVNIFIDQWNSILCLIQSYLSVIFLLLQYNITCKSYKKFKCKC